MVSLPISENQWNVERDGLVLHAIAKAGKYRRDTISSLLFTAQLILSHLLGAVTIIGKHVSNLWFEDGIVLLSKAGDYLQGMIKDSSRENARVDLNNVIQKVSVMFTSLGRGPGFLIRSQPLESVQEYVYLGHIITVDSDHRTEIYRRIKLRWSASGGAFRTGSLPLPLQGKEHNHFILLVSAYGSSRLTSKLDKIPGTAQRLVQRKKKCNITRYENIRADQRANRSSPYSNRT